jgi:large repetitive protein
MDKQYDTVICEGNSVNLSAGGAISYEWTPHAGLDDPFSPNPTATPTNTTTYYLTGYGEACNIIYNGDFSGGYDGFSTAYTYDPDLHPEGNFYIGDNPNDYHSNFAACGDHTTGTGDMMVINGSPVANEEIWCQDIVVLPNTDYVFSTWLTSVHPSNPAILQFSINGSLLGSPFPATATTCDWNQFYATWNSGANTNITICIVNQNTIATGNDFAIDDIYFSPICPSVNADSVKITVNPNPTPVLPVNTAACIHDLPFTIDVGNGYADYAWNTAETTQAIDVNTTGNYSVTVTDGNGCTNETSTSFVVNPVPDVTTVVSSNYSGQDISCFGLTDGSAEVQHNSGTPPYFYLWDVAAGAQTTQEATNLGAGTYFVTITDSNGCTIDNNITLVEPPQLDATTSVTSDYNGEDISCNGFTDGSAEVIPTDGTPPYTYLWDAAAGNQTTQEATNLGAGTYFVTVTDDNGCTIERNITLVEPTQLDATTSVTSDYNGEDISCNGFTDGSAEVIPTEGTPPYTYLWDAAAGNQTTQEATNLGAGTYSVTVTDDNGCTIERNITLVEPPQLDAITSVTSDYNGEDISCNGFTDGSAEVNPTDGTPPYTYLWDAAAGNQTTQEATNLGAGTYFVTVTDDNGCTIERSITLVDPTQLDATTSVTSDYNGENISCNGFTDGSAEVVPTDGTAPYTYLWDAAAGNQTTQEATNLGAGIYSVTVTDDNGCTIERSIVVSQPAQLNASVNVSSNYHGQHISCNGLSDGSALVSPINGTAPYNYQWDASTGNQISQEANNLSAGNYNVTITDINGCSISRNITLNEPTVLTVNTSSVDVVCGSSLGSVTAHPSGATPGYNYLWSNGIQNQTATGLIVGNYLVTVTDINGCTTIASSSVEPFGNLNITFTLQEPVSCYSYTDAVLLSHVSNGVPQFEYIWSNGDNQSSITNVGEGNYTLTVNDSWGCYGVNNFYIDQPTEIVLNYATNDVLCYGDSNGSATVLAAGGFPPYSYDWINGNNSNMVTDLSAGIYPVSVTDSRACTVVGEAVIQQPDRLTASFQIDSINCFGETGAIKANVAGGTSPYSYLWTSGVYNSSEQLIVNIPEAVYYLNIVDNNSCEFDTLVNMPQPEPLTATYVFDRPSCIGNWDGAIEVILSGGTAPYYSNLGISVDYHIYLDGLYEGLYEFDITDYRGCELYVGPVELIDIQVECLTIPNAFTPNGDGVNDTWQIENIHMYPGAQIQIFNRWGQLLWMGSPSTEWDGTYNNKPVPTATYIYVINLYNGEDARIGNVTVVY